MYIYNIYINIYIYICIYIYQNVRLATNEDISPTLDLSEGRSTGNIES